MGGSLEDEDLGGSGGDVAEVLGHIEACDVADGPSEFDAGGASADDDEVERGMGSGLHHLALGELEGEEDAAADFGGVFDGFEAGGDGGPLILAEVGVGGAGGEDEVVVFEVGAGPEENAVLVEGEAGGLIHEDFDVAMVAEDGADGLGDIGGGEHGEGDLVEERLEDVVVLAVDEGDVDWELGETHGGVNAGKASAKDDDAFAVGAGVGDWFECHAVEPLGGSSTGYD